MNKHIRYILHGLYEVLIFMLGVGSFAGLILGLVFFSQWIMDITADHPAPFIAIAAIASCWFLGFSKESSTKYKLKE